MHVYRCALNTDIVPINFYSVPLILSSDLEKETCNVRRINGITNGKEVRKHFLFVMPIHSDFYIPNQCRFSNRNRVKIIREKRKRIKEERNDSFLLSLLLLLSFRSCVFVCLFLHLWTIEELKHLRAPLRSLISLSFPPTLSPPFGNLVDSIP